MLGLDSPGSSRPSSSGLDGGPTWQAHQEGLDSRPSSSGGLASRATWRMAEHNEDESFRE